MCVTTSLSHLGPASPSVPDFLPPLLDTALALSTVCLTVILKLGRVLVLSTLLWFEYVPSEIRVEIRGPLQQF